MAHRISDFEPPRAGSPSAGMSDAQFAELKTLLQPCAELAKLLLEEFRRKAVAPPRNGEDPFRYHDQA